MPFVRTVPQPVEVEIPKVKGSRFIGLLAPAADEAALHELIAGARRRWPDATHHCWAWISQAGLCRSSDDGEPSGTAGPPILRRLEGAELRGVVLIVVRVFGGTKLGTGGLVRAYGECAAAALALADVVEVRLTTGVRVVHSYSDAGPVQGALHPLGLTPRSASYAEQVELRFDVPDEAVDDLLTLLRDRTAGRCIAERESV